MPTDRPNTSSYFIKHMDCLLLAFFYSSFSLVQQPNSVLGHLTAAVAQSNTIRTPPPPTHTHTQQQQHSSERVIRLSQTPSPTQQTNIHALNGFRTHEPSNRDVSDLRL